MDANGKRPWYRLHLGTVLTVFFVATAWMGNCFPLTIERFWPGGHVDSIEEVDLEGWPLICVNWGSYEAPATVANLIIAMVCVFSVGYTVETLARSRVQFSLSSALLVLADLGILFAFWRWDSEQTSVAGRWEPIPGPDDVYAPLQQFSQWYLAIPIYFALACMFHSCLSFAVRAASWSLAHLRRPAPARLKQTAARRGDPPSR
jgi:hypothetical protein